MSHQPRRIFVYKPSVPDHEPGQGIEREPEEEPRDLTIWLFSPVGAVLVWFLALLLIVPGTGVALLILPENYGILVAGLGLWIMLGLAVIHWWLPPGRPWHRHAEGIAVAGWHILLTAGSTGVLAWVLLFPDGRRPVFTLGDVYPVVVVGGILLIMFGTILTLLRGYDPGLGLRYAWTMLCMLAVWMVWWLVAAHGGVIV